MKTFKDLCVGDKIYVFIPPDDLETYTIEEKLNINGDLMFLVNKGSSIIIESKNTNKSLCISEDFNTFVDNIITDPEIVKWFNLKI